MMKCLSCTFNYARFYSYVEAKHSPSNYSNTLPIAENSYSRSSNKSSIHLHITIPGNKY